jgi:hypothetical protein
VWNHSRRTLCLRALRVLGVLCGSFASAEPCSAADIRTWAFEATIVNVNDPQMLFGDVRLGDPVRGTFSYDVSLPEDPSSNPPEWADYTHPGWFQGLRMAVENPRTDEELRYGRAANHYRDWFVAVFTEAYFYAERPSVVAFWQTTEPAPRSDLSTLVYVEFAGQNVLTDIALPTSYDLDDWPDAAIYLDAENGPAEAIAQFHTITPIMPGDFTLNGTVDADDYSLWRSTYGPTGISEADWGRNGAVDNADYVLWRNNLPVASQPSSAGMAPEPTGTVLCLVAVVAFAQSRHRLACRGRRRCVLRHRGQQFAGGINRFSSAGDGQDVAGQ